MAVTEQAVEIDEQKLGAFMDQAVGELGATLSAALVVIGDQLGLYKAMAGAGPVTSAQLAERTGTAERYVREWLNAQAAGGYVTYDAATGRYTLPPEQALALADEASPSSSAARSRASPRSCATSPRSARRSRAAPASAGTSTTTISSRAPSASSARATTRISSPSWIPALDGVEAKLRARRARGRRRLRPRRLDDPHGEGVSRIRSSSASTTTRRRSRPRASAPRTPASRDRVRFEVAPASGFPGTLRPRLRSSTACTTWATRSAPRATSARRSRTDGTWLIVEPFAGDNVEDNLNPVGRVYYGASTLVCTPASLSQEVGLGLGAQAGEARLRDVVDRRRVHALPPRDGDAVQPRARGAAVSSTISATMSQRPATRAREPDHAGLVAQGGVRIAYESFGEGRRPSSSCRAGRSCSSASGRRRCRISPAIAASSRSTRAATAARTGPRTRLPTRDREVAADALAVLDALGIEQAALVSLSGGAIPALMLAADHPRARHRRGLHRAVPCRSRRAPRASGRLRRRAARVRGLGALQPARLAAATSRASASASSARSSRSRTRPGRSRAASSGRAARPASCWPRRSMRRRSARRRRASWRDACAAPCS